MNKKEKISGTDEPNSIVWRFANAEFDEARWELRVAGQVMDMEPRPLVLLLQLLRNAGEVLTHDELLDAVYGRRHVTEGVIANAIAKLRKALGDDERALIVTVPRVGYRLVAPVTTHSVAQPDPVESTLKAGDAISQRPHWQLVKALSGGGLGGETWLGEQGKSREQRVFKFATNGVQLAGLKREITLSRVLRDGLGERADIARVLDWNIETAPWFIELEWQPAGNLSAWAAASGGLATLPLANRLEIAAQVADALGAAHSVGVLHKDLKPSNILVAVDGQGRPLVKLTDFGSGRVLDEAFLANMNITRLGFTVHGLDAESTSGTPMYLAPELIAGQAATVQADIYALGVLLYQLVIGDFRQLLAPGWEHRVEDELLREDIASAADGDPVRRLGDATQLAQRLRTLDERRQQRERERTERERAREQQRALERARSRRRWLLAIAATSVLGLAGSLWYAWATQRARVAEQHQALRAQQMQSFLFGLFRTANADHTGKPAITVPELLSLGLSQLPPAIHEPADRRQLQLSLAESLYLSGNAGQALDVFTKVAQSAAADQDAAQQAEADAFAGRIEIEKNEVAAGRQLEAQALKLVQTAGIPPRVKVLAEAYYAFNEDNNGYQTDANLALLRSAAQQAQAAGLDRDEVAQTLSYLAIDLDLRGNHSKEVRSIDQQLLTLYGNDPQTLCERSNVYGQLAWLDDIEGNPAAGLPLFEKAYQGYILCSGPDSTGALDQLPYWSDALMRTGRAADALALLETAMPTWRRVVGGNPDYTDMLFFLARADLANGKPAEAEHPAAELLSLVEKNLAPGARSIGSAHLVLGQSLAGQHRYREALPHSQAAASILVNSKTPYGQQWDKEAAELQRQVQLSLAAGT